MKMAAEPVVNCKFFLVYTHLFVLIRVYSPIFGMYFHGKNFQDRFHYKLFSHERNDTHYEKSWRRYWLTVRGAMIGITNRFERYNLGVHIFFLIQLNQCTAAGL